MIRSMGRAMAALTGVALVTAALAGCGSSLGTGGTGGTAGAGGVGGKAMGSGGAAAGSGGPAVGGAGGVGGKATGSGGAGPATGSGGAAAGSGGHAASGAGGVGGKATGSGGAAAGSGGHPAGGAGGVGGNATGLGGAAAGSGGQAAGGAAGVVHPLPGATQVDIQSGHCVTINAVAQTLPPSVVSFDLIDGGGASANGYRVAAVPSNYTCGADPLEEPLPPYISERFTGSASDSAQFPAGDYNLDVICENLVNDCLITSITWSAVY
jgi:hypothetical protein